MDGAKYPPSIRSKDGNRNIQLNESPSVAEVDEWMMALGCQTVVAGKTFQGRDILLYWMDVSLIDSAAPSLRMKRGGKEVGRIDDSKNVLFLSLVHGNEPMGLISLLMGAKELASASGNDLAELSRIRVYFVPVVNVDGYEANLALGEDERGCHRSNLRPTCDRDLGSPQSISNTTTIPINSCVSRRGSNGGVDLNRNFPSDWEAGNQASCSGGYPGPHPLSEPETQTIAKVVREHNITAAMSLHSRASFGREALLIHPYASERSLQLMNKIDATRFREWSYSMTQHVNGYYRTGTAMEAIQYTASGSTIDWMYGEQRVVSFVLEAVPPCDIRWCRGNDVYRSSQLNSYTMAHFVRLAFFEKDHRGTMDVIPIFVLLFIFGMLYFSAKRHHNCRLFLYRFCLPILSKDKEEIAQDEKR